MSKVYNAGRMKRALLVTLLVAACAAPPPAPVATPEPEPTPASSPQPQAETPVGTVRVTASMLNVRGDASTSADVVGHARRGERLTVFADRGDWLRVRTGGGEIGWVSSDFVTREGTLAKPRRRGCPPDSDYRFVTEPKPAFSDSAAHGIVTVEANVDARGNVTSTKTVSNTTGDPALATLTEHEIAAAKFAPPVRACVPKAFIFTYRRAF